MPKKVKENKNVQFLCDLSIQSDREINHQRPDIINHEYCHRELFFISGKDRASVRPITALEYINDIHVGLNSFCLLSSARYFYH